jgi:hypothetical protein
MATAGAGWRMLRRVGQRDHLQPNFNAISQVAELTLGVV